MPLGCSVLHLKNRRPSACRLSLMLLNLSFTTDTTMSSVVCPGEEKCIFWTSTLNRHLHDSPRVSSRRRREDGSFTINCASKCSLVFLSGEREKARRQTISFIFPRVPAQFNQFDAIFARPLCSVPRARSGQLSERLGTRQRRYHVLRGTEKSFLTL